MIEKLSQPSLITELSGRQYEPDARVFPLTVSPRGYTFCTGPTEQSGRLG